jgi:hypothetical protein
MKSLSTKKYNKCIIFVFSTFLFFTSCLGPEDEGNPETISEYDFDKAWKEAVATEGELIKLATFEIGQFNKIIYAVETNGPGRNGVYSEYTYDTVFLSKDSSAFKSPLNEIFPINAIKNDNGDTLFLTKTDDDYKEIIYKSSFPALFFNKRASEYSQFKYLYSINGVKYDLMKDIRSTYSSKKALQEIHLDTLIPF